MIVQVESHGGQPLSIQLPKTMVDEMASVEGDRMHQVNAAARRWPVMPTSAAARRLICTTAAAGTIVVITSGCLAFDAHYLNHRSPSTFSMVCLVRTRGGCRPAPGFQDRQSRYQRRDKERNQDEGG